MSTCNWLDLQTLGSQPIMPKNLPGHCLLLIHLSTLVGVNHLVLQPCNRAILLLFSYQVISVVQPLD